MFGFAKRTAQLLLYPFYLSARDPGEKVIELAVGRKFQQQSPKI